MYAANSFQILKRCHTEYETEIQQALLIKKLNPKLNQQLYAKKVPLFCLVFSNFFFNVMSYMVSMLSDVSAMR